MHFFTIALITKIDALIGIAVRGEYSCGGCKRSVWSVVWGW